jgi:hypothetical protein
LTIFFDLEEIFFEFFNISENNIISVELVKVLRYPDPVKPIRLLWGKWKLDFNGTNEYTWESWTSEK